jgi:DNA-binding IscR family transcriptional regulator
MALDTRLSRVLHVLIHMHLKGGKTTSDTIAQMLHTNPVVVRRMMAALRRVGYVASTGGHGGGWVLTTTLDALTIRDVYDVLAPTSLFALGPAQDNPECLVEAAVNRVLEQEMRAAEDALLGRLGKVRLIELVPEPEQKYAEKG